MTLPEIEPAITKKLFETGDTVAAEILRQAYPDQPATIEQRIDRAKAIVYIVDCGDGKEVLRLSASSRYTTHNIANAYRAWEQIDIPVPHVKEAGVRDPLQYLLLAHIPEPPFTFDLPADIQLKVSRQMGGFLAKMRSVSLEGFGYLDKDGDGEFTAWNELVKSYYSHEWILKHGGLSGAETAAIQNIKNMDFPQHGSALLHGDYKLKNMFVGTDGKITAVTDPKPMAGDPLWDFAVFNHFVYREQARQNRPYDDASFTSLRKVFKEGYETQLERNLIDEELNRIALYEILIDTGKAETLKRGKLDESVGESDFILSYLKHKLRRLAP